MRKCCTSNACIQLSLGVRNTAELLCFTQSDVQDTQDNLVVQGLAIIWRTETDGQKPLIMHIWAFMLTWQPFCFENPAEQLQGAYVGCHA